MYDAKQSVVVILLFIFSIFKASAQKVQVEKIEIIGNKRTKESVILREILLSPKSTYSLQSVDSLLQISKNLLWNLKLFNDVLVSTQFIDSQGRKIKVVVELVERWYLWPWPFVESADRNINQWIQFNLDPQRTNYGMYLFLFNLRGRNETLKLTFSEGYTKSLGAEYQIPNIDKAKKWSAKAKINQKKNEEIWYNTFNDKLQFFRMIGVNMVTKNIAQLEMEFRPKYFFRHKMGVDFQSVKVHDTVVKKLNPKFIFNDQNNYQQTLSLSYEMEYDQRNNKYYPTNGKYFAMDNKWIHFLNTQNKPIWQAKLSFIQAKKWHNSWGGITKIQGKVSSPVQPYYFYKSLGYKDVLRGYENNVIDGAQYVSNQNSMYYQIVQNKTLYLNRLPFDNYKNIPFNMFATAHIDQAWVDNQLFSSGNQLSNSYLLGYGVGLHFLWWNDRIFKVEYSANRRSKPYLYFSFLSTF